MTGENLCIRDSLESGVDLDSDFSLTDFSSDEEGDVSIEGLDVLEDAESASDDDWSGQACDGSVSDEETGQETEDDGSINSDNG